MVKLLIVADDFTGALDTGVQFAASGTATKVIIKNDYNFNTMDESAQVLVMDMETRHLDGKEAYRVVYQIIKRACASGISFIYKKTDSALRGNIGSELAAALDASGSGVVHFLPAFPKMGRITKNGVHYINGIPVAESVFGKDPFEPVLDSCIPDLIQKQAGVPVEVVHGCSVANSGSHPYIAVYDIEKDEEFDLAALRLEEEGGRLIMAGCAGFAATLPRLLKLGGSVRLKPQFKERFLVVCGSVNPITRAQLDYAEKAGFKRIRLTPAQKLGGDYWQAETGKAQLEVWKRILRREPCCILDTNDPHDGEDSLDYARDRGMTVEEVRVRISTTLGYLVKELVHGGVDSTLLITGGDTLLGFMKQMGVYEMEPVCEMEPGTVLSRFKADGKIYEVISKSGGFGAESLMTDLSERILTRERKGEILLC